MSHKAVVTPTKTLPSAGTIQRALEDMGTPFRRDDKVSRYFETVAPVVVDFSAALASRSAYGGFGYVDQNGQTVRVTDDMYLHYAQQLETPNGFEDKLRMRVEALEIQDRLRAANIPFEVKIEGDAIQFEFNTPELEAGIQ